MPVPYNSDPKPTPPGHGAFVISLDFELHWGVRDKRPANGPYRRNLLGARTAVAGMLSLFEEFGIRATWATVGFLFARSRKELHEYSPARRPEYRNPKLSAYEEPVGQDEAEDPLHYGASLIDEIANHPGQEIASHTFSHYYCCEPGQDAEAFSADLASAVAIARRRGIELRSLVFPRNQVNPGYRRILREHGFSTYRSDPTALTAHPGLSARAARLADSYIDLRGHRCTSWQDVIDDEGLCDVRSSAFLRCSSRPAWLRRLQVERICGSLRHAAQSNSIFHLWWHPHNFGASPAESLSLLQEILQQYRLLHEHHGLRSMHMADVAAAVQPDPAKRQVEAAV